VHSGLETELNGEDIGVRVIKPYKRFYEALMSVALRYGLDNLHTLNVSDFRDAVQHFTKSYWKPSLSAPAEAFFDCLRLEKSKLPPPESSELFENLHARLGRMWDAEIIARSNDFKKAKIEPS
jgi:hypothetical protein